MTEPTESLLPCPFCGCTTVRQFEIFEQSGWAIDCNRCNGGFHNVPRDEGIKRWNQRATTTHEQGLVERVDYVVKMARQYEAAVMRVPDAVHGAGERLEQAKRELFAAITPPKDNAP